ncbi:MAG: hypothetical protein EAZ70_02735 [Runella slithyformis]|nr:MAG: hypothetical protein EAY79_02970 [Runella slithyformis]TAF02487.1 MAG: hypothetical protein EAZ80_01060 [Runella slithyformis]TAF29161.1 MAG: hypothetical protein EAZ70_02735 [Runella slithyformis]TAF48115.1 MAG: hypothetical protein EAZ63_06440 [Runella slithyformis]TAF82905.1 MAG: hypothetical protein EAZ50_02990 [Runella slithyformis]
MNFNVRATLGFKRQLKKIVKKHPDMKGQIDKLIDVLTIEPSMGTPLGKDCFKIRLAIPSKNKGKSGGARVITHVRVLGEVVFLLSIYDKSEQDSVTDATLDTWIEDLSE